MLKKLDIPLIQDADLKDKIVLVRVDHNVVKKGVIHDPYRVDTHGLTPVGIYYNHFNIIP